MSAQRKTPTEAEIKMAVAVLLRDAMRHYPASRSIVHTREWVDISNWMEDVVLRADVGINLPTPTTMFSSNEEVDLYAIARFDQIKEREAKVTRREAELAARDKRVHEFLMNLSEQLARATLTL